MLAQKRRAWHGAAMEHQSRKASRAGGAIIAFSVMAGWVIGVTMHQPSLGTVIGTALGAAITLALYLYDRRAG